MKSYLKFGLIEEVISFFQFPTLKGKFTTVTEKRNILKRHYKPFDISKSDDSLSDFTCQYGNPLTIRDVNEEFVGENMTGFAKKRSANHVI